MPGVDPTKVVPSYAIDKPLVGADREDHVAPLSVDLIELVEELVAAYHVFEPKYSILLTKINPTQKSILL